MTYHVTFLRTAAPALRQAATHRLVVTQRAAAISLASARTTARRARLAQHAYRRVQLARPPAPISTIGIHAPLHLVVGV